MKTFLKGLAVLIAIVWGVAGAFLLLGQTLICISGSNAWTPADTGWWQLLIYGALIGWALFLLFKIIVALGEWVEDR